MKSSHAEAMKAKAAADTAEALHKLDQRLTRIEKMLEAIASSATAKKSKKEGEQAAPPQPDEA
jgi:hypothetical protein